ncbi:MAG: hypothetical protein KatS3mg105_3709 [Gemmatales bacterium]|nr:MAG: hypothetical protein KatS3mg105_3709 [Gemmatales bacterium]
MNRLTSRSRRTVVLNAVLSLVLILVVLQLWLLAATIDASLGGDDSVVWPAAIASGACFALNGFLLRYARRLW